MRPSRREHEEILASGIFSGSWYLARYADVAAAQIDPVQHYLSHGAREGRDPGPTFSTSSYLARYREEIAGSGLPPLVHYLRHGRRAGYDASPLAARRSYRSFQEFLKHSLLFPTMPAPFGTPEEDCFTAMAGITEGLCRQLEQSPSPPLVSIIMPMLNRAAVVAASVHSVLEQSYRNFELIVIDDGSRDHSANVIRSFADPRIRLLENAQRMGVCFARNRGLAEARGELVAYLDSDNTWRPDYLKAMAGAFQTLPDAGAAYSGQYLYRGDHHQPFAMRFAAFNPSLLHNINYIDINCFMHRRSVLECLDSWFCEELSRFEDWEFVIKVARTTPVYSIPVIQSNYYFDKAAVTISNSESMAGPLEIIRRMNRTKGEAIPAGSTPDKVAIVAVNSFAGHQRQAYRKALLAATGQPATRVSILNHAGQAQRSGMRSLLMHLTGAKPAVAGDTLAQSVSREFTASAADCDLLLLANGAVPAPDAVRLLRECAHSCDSIAVVTPQQILKAGSSEIVAHIPEANVSFPCDVALSYLYERLRPLPVFHCGRIVELDSAPPTCLYIKRRAWDLFGGFGDKPGGLQEHLDSFFDFVGSTLGMKIVYSPAPAVGLKHFQQDYWSKR
jgi:GT2 family glycosyltransferase